MLLSLIGVLGLAGTGLAAPFVTSAPSGADLDEWCKTSTIPKKLSGCPETPEEYEWLEDPSDDEKLDFSNKERRDEPAAVMLPRSPKNDHDQLEEHWESMKEYCDKGGKVGTSVCGDKEEYIKVSKLLCRWTRSHI
ncbi:hypothetical protein IMZ48_37920 [Candidatus Bathyarchaeota archaeon]|nr:hypothetical protein [Candidatus Bathyarchaeota archaeon]